MRIAHLIPHGVHPYSGLLASIVGGALALARHGAQVEIWGFRDVVSGDGDLALLPAAAENLTIREMPEPGSRLKLGSYFVDLLHQFSDQIEIVHIHGVFSPANNRIARQLRVPYVVSPHGGYAAGTMAYHHVRKRVFLTVLDRPMLDRAAVVCSLTQQESTDVRALGYGGPLAIAPNGVNPAPDNLNRQALRSELGLDRNVPLAVYAGRIDVRQKRLDVMVNALRGNSWHLALLGGDF